MRLFSPLLLFSSVLATVEIEVSDVAVFAGKDATTFSRDGIDEVSSVSLVLIEESLFLATTVTVTATESTNITAEFSLNDGDFETISTTEVSEDISFELSTDLDDFISVQDRGTNTFTLKLTATTTEEDVEVETSVSVFTITNFMSVFPLLMLVILALMSRNVYISMFFGIWIGSLIIEEGDIINSFKALFDDHLVPSITDEFNFRTITFTLFLGGFISMIKKGGGQEGFSAFIGRYATSPRKTQLAAVTAGVGLFFDDYSSVLILGSSFKTLTDKFYVSREKLAFVADATAAPIASIAPISSWIAFELSRIAPELEAIVSGSEFESRNDLPSEYPFFLQTIKSRYYPFYMLVIQITLIVAGVEFGPMLYAERKTRLGKRTDGGDGRMEIPLEQDTTNPSPDTPKKAWNFFIPISFFITSLLVSLVNIGVANIDAENEFAEEGEEIEYILREIFGNTDSFAALVYTTMGASLFGLIWFMLQFKKDGKIVLPTQAALISIVDCRIKSAEDLAVQEGIEVDDSKKSDIPRPIMFFTEGVNTWVEGFKNLVPAVLVLCLAFTIKSIVTGCATDRFFTDIILNSDISAEALPTIIFIVASLLSLATGTSFGTMSIMFPLVSFATFEKSEGDIDLFTIALSSIMAGAIFGDHSSLISDTTILSSIGSGCSIGAHVYTQMPYALWGGLWAIIFGTLPAGFGANPVVILIFGMIIMGLATIAVGAPIVAASGRLDLFSEFLLKFKCGSKGMFADLEDFKEATKEFAELNPDMVDPEPLDYVKSLFGVKTEEVKDSLDEIEEEAAKGEIIEAIPVEESKLEVKAVETDTAPPTESKDVDPKSTADV